MKLVGLANAHLGNFPTSDNVQPTAASLNFSETAPSRSG